VKNSIQTIILNSLMLGFSFMSLQPILKENKSKNTIISQNLKKNFQEESIEEQKNIVDELVTLAKSKIGSPYIYAKIGPDSFDCSGFVYYLFNHYKIALPRTSLAQSQSGKQLLRTQIQKGDILFFDTSGKGYVNHSGIYLGEDQFIHASSGKAKGVTISSLNTWYKDKFKWGIRKIK